MEEVHYYTWWRTGGTHGGGTNEGGVSEDPSQRAQTAKDESQD